MLDDEMLSQNRSLYDTTEPLQEIDFHWPRILEKHPAGDRRQHLCDLKMCEIREEGRRWLVS